LRRGSGETRLFVKNFTTTKMARLTTTLTIFISCPSQLLAEKQGVKNAVDIVNRSIRGTCNVQLETWDWEEGAIPGIAATPQEVIDQQIPQHDIYLGLLWHRFGFPTAMCGSGTEHEFRTSLKSHQQEGSPRHILFFFKTKVDNLDDVDPLQYAQVRTFQNELQDLGVLYNKFEDSSDFEKILVTIFTRIALGWSTSISAPARSVSQTEGLVLTVSSAQDDMESDKDDLDFGYLDYLENFEERMSVAGELVVKIGAALNEMTDNLGSRSKEINEATSIHKTLPARLAKSFVDSAADDMMRFTHLAGPLIDEAQRNFEEGIDCLNKTLVAQAAGGNQADSDKQINGLDVQLKELLEVLVSSDESMDGMTESVLELPNATLKFNKAKRNVISFTDKYKKMTSSIRSMILNVRQTLK
jgi:hypothetical protein